MLKRTLLTVGAVAFGTLMLSHQSFGQATTTTTTETYKQSVTTAPKAAPVKKKAKAAAVPMVETTDTVVTTTPPEPRPVYDQAALKKMNTLCVSGFDAKVGNDKKNVCFGLATAPDIAYSCVWMKKGEVAYPPTAQGPCNLDYVEHRGNVVISKADYKSSPPLSYGTKVECCFRAAKGVPKTSVDSTTIVSPVKK